MFCLSFKEISSRSRLDRLILTALSLAVSQGSLFAQANVAGESHTNSLGTVFKPIPNSPILFAATETKVTDYQAFINSSGYKWDAAAPHFPQTGDHPVINVTLQDARAFCLWLTENERKSGKITELQSYRLPTNREWDTAVGLASARQSSIGVTQEIEDSRSFPWGVEWPPPSQSGNFNSFEINGSNDGYAFTAPVGVFAPSKEGLFDLAGNVWEWTWDQEDRADAPGTLRGGSWMYFRKECLLSSYTYFVPVTLRATSVGFRYVFEDKQKTALYLATVQKEAAALNKEKRSMLSDGPTVSSDEIKKMRESLERKPVAEVQQKIPDPSTLKPVETGKEFINSLGMSLRPLSDDSKVLFGEHEVRVQDYDFAQKAQGRTWSNRPSFDIKDMHPVVNVTWQDAVDFCAWLTEKDRAAKLIPATASYRLPSDAEWSEAVGLTDETGQDPAEKSNKNTQHFPWGAGQWPPPPLSANLDTARMTAYSDNYTHTAPVGSF